MGFGNKLSQETDGELMRKRSVCASFKARKSLESLNEKIYHILYRGRLSGMRDYFCFHQLLYDICA